MQRRQHSLRIAHSSPSRNDGNVVSSVIGGQLLLDGSLLKDNPTAQR